MSNFTVHIDDIQLLIMSKSQAVSYSSEFINLYDSESEY